MDEAERCDQIVYIAYGNLMTQGRVEDIIDQSGLYTFVAEGTGVRDLMESLRGQPGADHVAYFGSAQQNEFDGYLLDAIAAVVVGGTSLFGGRGGIGNTIIGLLILGVLNNGLDHINIDSFLKILIRGLILLIALIINVYAQNLRSSQATTGAGSE